MVVIGQPRRIGFVYFLEAEGIGMVKVGHSRDPARRLADLRMVSPVPLRPLGLLRGSTGRERRLHRRFAALRSHGEWFRAGQELMEFVRREARPWDGCDRQVRGYATESAEVARCREEEQQADWDRAMSRLREQRERRRLLAMAGPVW